MTYQMGDSLGGLIFIFAVLVEAILFVRIIYLIIQRRSFARTIETFAGIIVVYFLVLAGVGMASREKLISQGSVECFDDWCASVTQTKTEGSIVTLEVQIINRAQRASQTPDHPRLVLIDNNGNKYNPMDSTVSLNSKLDAGKSVTSQVRFQIAPGMTPSKALLTEGSGPPLIGDQNSYFHQKTYFDLRTGK